MNHLNPHRSRLLAVGLLLILLLLVALLVRPVLSGYLNYGERIESLENQLSIYQRLAEGLADAQARLASLRAAEPVTDLYLPQNKPALAAAHLQQYLHSQVSRGGGQVISTQILTSAEAGPLQTIAIQVHMRGELDDLVDLLYSLELGKPALFAENITVLANPRRQARVLRRTNRQVESQVVPALDIRFDLTGFAPREKTL
uniref:type II secretion system protein GspM n=1 Tax=Marinobacterium profundum TaxID=1714300 RepID=UPI00082F4735|nr:type II secretion system protein GspM [Marinobacterium profundum]